MRVSFLDKNIVSRVFVALFAFVALFTSAACSSSTSSDVDSSADEQPNATQSQESVKTDKTNKTDNTGSAEGSETETTADAEPATADQDSQEAAGQSEQAAASQTSIEKPPIEEEYLGEVKELEIIDLLEGEGPGAQAGSMLQMHYVGVLASDGTEFDNSYDRGQGFSFTLGQGGVIAGWDEGIVGMKKGGRRLLRIPSDKAYGDQDRGDIIKANSDLIFVVDMLGIITKPTIDEKYLGAVDTLETFDLVEGSGREAKHDDIASVQYLIVNPEGVEVDSSWNREATPFPFAIGRSPLPEGWTQGVLGMKVGGERIIRIPQDMAFNDGDVIIEVHLEELKDAPALHKHEFSGEQTDGVTVTELVAGSGPESKPGDSLDTNLVLISYVTGEIMESSFIQGESLEIVLSERGENSNPVNDALLGIKVGETREVIIPAEVYFGGEIPPQADIADDDALVFIVEVLSID